MTPGKPQRPALPRVRLLGRAFFLALVAFLAVPAAAQTLPYHADPDAREILPGANPVPAIRFLTTADFPPFNYRDAAGNLIGFNIDLAKAICTDVNVACTIQAWPWDQAANALADNQGDALIAGLALTAENGERFDFSQTYLALPGRFVTRQGEGSGAAPVFRPAALAGQRVALRGGSAHDAFVARYLPAAEIVRFDTELAALEAVRAGEAAAYFGDALRAAFWLNDNPGCCAFAGEPYFRPQLFGAGLAIAVAAGHDPVRHALDRALVRLKENGTLDELYLRWFPIGFY